MNKLEQAARQALEALEVYEIKLNSRLCNEAITALREALAEQAEQEPVKRFTSDDVKVAFENGYAAAMSVADIAKEVEQEPVAFCGYCKSISCTCPVLPMPTANAAPVCTKDLTDDEIDRIAAESTGLLYLDFARAVIAADREKNK